MAENGIVAEETLAWHGGDRGSRTRDTLLGMILNCRWDVDDVLSKRGRYVGLSHESQEECPSNNRIVLALKSPLISTPH